MPPSARRRQPKPPALPIDLEEIEHDPGFRGMLSFLEVSPADRAALLAQRADAEARAAGQSPTGTAPVVEPPEGAQTEIVDNTSVVEPPLGASPGNVQPSTSDLSPGTGPKPTGQPPPGAPPYMDVEGRGKRALRFCQTVQDGHTASEHLAYQTLWNYASRYGRAESAGSSLVDVGLSQLCTLLATDHKNVKRLIGSLRDKLALEIVRQPDYRLAVPTRYRIFHSGEILERRRNAGLIWVIRTRTVRFVDLDTVNRLMGEQGVGLSPMGSSWENDQRPMGVSSELPAGQQGREESPSPFPTALAQSLNQWITIGDPAVRQMWNACRRGLPDCTEDEVHWFCRSKEPLIRSGKIDDPIALLIRSVPQCFANGGGPALLDYRKERSRAQERDRKRQRQIAMMVLDDPESTPAEAAWAKEILETS